MRRPLLALAKALAMLLLLPPTAASTGDVTLHPSGFGEHSCAAWIAQEGLPDNTGNRSISRRRPPLPRSPRALPCSRALPG